MTWEDLKDLGFVFDKDFGYWWLSNTDKDELRRLVGMIGNLCDSVRLLCLPTTTGAK